jgi:hypothetical protein
MSEAPAGSGAADVPPRWVRFFVWALLAAVLVCGAAGLEAWPFSGFRLFSQVRTPHTVSYRLATVDGAGNERALPFRALPPGFRGLSLDLGSAAAGMASDRAGLCGAIAEGARSIGRDVAGVRVYEVVRDLSQRVGRTSVPSSHHLAFSCGARSGFHASG